jgi:hypothetical protein
VGTHRKSVLILQLISKGKLDSLTDADLRWRIEQLLTDACSTPVNNSLKELTSAWIASSKLMVTW